LTALADRARSRMKEISQTRADEKLTEYEQELALFATVEAKIDDLSDDVRAIEHQTKVVIGKDLDAGQRGILNLREMLSTHADKARQQHQHYANLKLTAAAYADALPHLEAEAQQRKEQMKRLRGGMFGSFRRVGADSIDPAKHLPIIIDLLCMERGATVTLRRQLQPKLDAEWEKAAAEVVRWLEENEVATYAVQHLRYGFDTEREHDRHTASVLFRTIQHIKPYGAGDLTMDSRAIDTAARLLQLPFSPSQVQSMIGSKAGYAPMDLRENVYLIDPATEQVAELPMRSREYAAVWVE
jgi:hypothetical protein